MIPRQNDAPHNPQHAATTLAASLRGTLRLARELVVARRDVDLSGLSDEVGLLCARALDLPPDQGTIFCPELCRLLETVDELNTALREAAAPT